MIRIDSEPTFFIDLVQNNSEITEASLNLLCEI